MEILWWASLQNRLSAFCIQYGCLPVNRDLRSLTLGESCRTMSRDNALKKIKEPIDFELASRIFQKD